jgi:hypothetical protein
MIQGSGFRVHSLGFRVQGFVLRLHLGLGFVAGDHHAAVLARRAVQRLRLWGLGSGKAWEVEIESIRKNALFRVGLGLAQG